MFIERPVREAELAFLNAPFSDDGWLQAIRLLSVATRSSVSQLCGGGLGPELSFNLFSEERHDPHGHLVNPQVYGSENWRINCTAAGPRSIQHEAHYAAYRAGNPTSFYDDAVSDLDLPYGCQSPLMLDSGGLVGLALLRSSRDGPCSPEVLAAFARIAHQAHRALRVQLALGQERGEELLSALSTSNDRTVLLDRHGRLVALTEAAEPLFDCPIGLELAGLNVRLADPSEDKLLQAAIRRLGRSDGVDGPILHEAVVGRNEQQPGGYWRLFLTRIPARYDLMGVEAQFALTLRPRLPA